METQQRRRRLSDASIASTGSDGGSAVGNASTIGQSRQIQPVSDNLSNAKSIKQRVEAFAEGPYFTTLMSILTIWALYQSDIKYAATDKDADLGFLIIISITFFLFLLEIVMQIFYKEDYFCIPEWKAQEGESWSETWYRRSQIGSFYFWLDCIATVTLIFDLNWLLADAYDDVQASNKQSAKVGNASRTGARAGRVVRLVRMFRLVRMVKLYKYSETSGVKQSLLDNNNQTASGTKTHVEEDEMPPESKVGAAMSDLINRRVITLILLMLIIIPLLTSDDPDISMSLATQMIHKLAVLNATDAATYESGLNLAIKVAVRELPVIGIYLDDHYEYRNSHRIDSLRMVEKAEYELSDHGFNTVITFDQKHESIQGALYSIYTTSFIIVLLLLGTYFFSADVNKLVIGPIEHLVELVRKISANPLGVEYKMMGEKEGFLDGMETTILLTTITKIGALMRVGFGEAGAAIIARNLSDSSGGRLNLMGSGTMIKSIFGFCDVRQFTDTTECLQEEVMLFVNRIAHILHSIVVQCSGAANKNIGDAFLLTWKIDEKWTPEKTADIADQALLTFCKALIELCRYEEFICNFSIAATARLYKRFPEYKVRIGSGLHMGWAIEGAIGSNRKIDASYLSPHVSATEYLESSTKAYGVALLLSEPFYNLLSPTAKRYIRQVDRVRRSALEEPMGLYTYDSDLTINWNDPNRKRRSTVGLGAGSGGNAGGARKRGSIVGLTAAMKQKSTLAAQRARSSIAAGGRKQSLADCAESSTEVDAGDIESASRGRRRDAGRLGAISEDTHDQQTAHSANGYTQVPDRPHPSLTKENLRSRDSIAVGNSAAAHAALEDLHKSALGNHNNKRHQSTTVQPGGKRRSSTSGIVDGLSLFGHSQHPIGVAGREGTEEDQEAARKAREEAQNEVAAREVARKIEEEEARAIALMEEARREKAKETPTVIVPKYSQSVWVEDADLVDLRHRVSDAYRSLWQSGMEAYISGDWPRAKDVFEQTLEISLGKDGPSKFLLEEINKCGGEAPANWQGYRDEGGGGH